MLEKLTQMALLYDFYGELLTDKQREFFSLYYEDNLSLGEIAEENGVTRQAVYDLLKRTEKILLEYEEKLGLVQRFQKQWEQLEQVAKILTRLKEERESPLIEEGIRLLEAVMFSEEWGKRGEEDGLV